MQNALALVLGGGRGTRLYPLTKFRSKPAVPLAGKYRLIDIPLSNCINSGLNRMYVLTQFNSVSLHRHIRRTYIFDSFSEGFVEILAAQQTNESTNCYQGTADAVRQNVQYEEESGADYILILSGDQLYRMNYAEMIATHERSAADVTIATMPVTRDAAPAFGILRADDTGRVVGFLEKPKTNEEADMVRTEPAWIDSRGVASNGRDLLASMGIYVFNRKTLVDVLTKTDYHDFGREVFPPRCAAARCSCTFSTATGKTSARSNRSISATSIWRRRSLPSSCPPLPRRFTRVPVFYHHRSSMERQSAIASSLMAASSSLAP